MNADTPERKVVDILKQNNIDIAATLPCDRIKVLLLLIARNIRTIPLTREENGIGICAGVYLGGGRPVMVIQSTGIGNMINALCSLNLTYDIPIPVIASWRGVYKESIEAQWQLGRRLPEILAASGIKFTIIESIKEIDKLDEAIKESFSNSHPHVILVSPAVWEGYACEIPEPLEICSRSVDLEFSRSIKKPVLTRYEAIKSIVETIDDTGDIIVANLGIPSKELFEIRDRKLNFYMLGSMGLVSSIGLGLSIIQKKHVYVIDGDGSLLMNPNALISIGEYPAPNLTIIAIDNASYGSTGNQQTCTQSLIDLELLAKASGIKHTLKAHSLDELREALLLKAQFIHVIVKPVNVKCKEIPFSANEIKKRFMRALEA
ncbi:MAG: sulfopyruvate decarboxylase subunit beta [Candidatus Methanoperedens sp.]|nr:sulfopyruvate decarboxylase subunit beta [Candidatus Methanoperedens sp.]CAG0997551.1 sulfopyruvate decarboxylase subunit beta [Methanosarcinales archaeon]